MTLYSLLLQACGLSIREAAELHKVRDDTVKSWSAGRRTPPDGIVEQLRQLYDTIVQAADQAIETIETESEERLEAIEIGYPADDHEARQLGLPCIGAWRALAAIIAASVDMPLVFVPRGSTLSTAGAIQARES